MILACQNDSYLRKFETQVVSCEPSEKGYVAILEDTILFPEGGGQPSDFGTIKGIQVTELKRHASQVLHFIEKPLTPGEPVTVIVDWNRRHDHMQQHTGQHLLTAIAESEFSYHTTSWNLGAETSYIELDTPSIKKEDIVKLEQLVNEKIRLRIPVMLGLYEKDAPELTDVSTRLKLPEEHDGQVRVVSIDGIDRNTCCGTHVSNLCDLQCIKLLYAEKGNKKNKTHLYFVVGNRVLKYLDQCVSTERSLNSLLNCSRKNTVAIVQKLQKSAKSANKNFLLAMRELAVMEARVFKCQLEKPKFFSLHKKNAESDFISIFLNEVNDNETLFFLTVSDDKVGQMTLAGPDHLLEKYGPEVIEILAGKGSFKHGRYQGKFNKLSNLTKAESVLKTAVQG